jgi:hypothetical protein
MRRDAAPCGAAFVLYHACWCRAITGATPAKPLSLDKLGMTLLTTTSDQERAKSLLPPAITGARNRYYH